MDITDVGTRSVGPYVLGRTLGKGQTGHVKLGIHYATRETVAIKSINKRQLSEAILKKVEREIAIMKLIDHPHVLGLHDVYENSNYLYLILEHVTGGELFDYLVGKGRLSEREARQFFRQILSAVDFCHSHCIVHRDLKPENLLLDEARKIKVADFGMASLQLEDELLRTSCGSPHYACPEVIKGISYDGRKADVWSCGVILFALVVGSLPFDDRQGNLRVLLEKVKIGEFYMPPALSPQLQQLIRGMICVNPDKRLSITDVMRHSWTLHTSAPELESQIHIKEAIRTHAIPHRSDIDRDVLASMLRLGCFKFRGEVVHRLLSDSHNIEKVVYFLLRKRKETQPSQNDSDNADDSDSDSNRPRKRVDTTPAPMRKIAIFGTPGPLRRTSRTTGSFNDKVKVNHQLDVPAYVTPQQNRRFQKLSYHPHSPVRHKSSKLETDEKKSVSPKDSSPTETLPSGKEEEEDAKVKEISDTEIFSITAPEKAAKASASARADEAASSQQENPSLKRRITRNIRRVFESPRFHRKKFQTHDDSDSETGSQGPDDIGVKRSWFSNLLKHDRQEMFMVVKGRKLSVLKADIVRTLLLLNVQHTVESSTEFQLKYYRLKGKEKRKSLFAKVVKFQLSIGLHSDPKANIHTITMTLKNGSSRRFKRIAESIQARILNPLPPREIAIAISEPASPDTSDVDEYLTDSSGQGTPHSSPARRITVGAAPFNRRF